MFWVKRNGDKIISVPTETSENVLNVIECVKQCYCSFFFKLLKHGYTTVSFTHKHWESSKGLDLMMGFFGRGEDV